jgi:hypothetical protein
MPHYIIYFNQQWVGDHPEEWYDSRAPLAHAVVDEMREAGVLVVAGGVDEDLTQAAHADDTSGELVISAGPYRTGVEYIGGLTIVDVADDVEARMWAGKVAVACGWPQEVRRLYF